MHTPLGVVWPFLRFICCCCSPKKRFKQGLKTALRRKMQLRLSKSDAKIEANPYLLLGFGMNSYFEIMLNLMCMMLVASCFALVLMARFAQHDALTNQKGF